MSKLTSKARQWVEKIIFVAVFFLVQKLAFNGIRYYVVFGNDDGENV